VGVAGIIAIKKNFYMEVKMKNKWKVIAIAVIILLAIIVAGIIGWWIFGGSTDFQKTEDNSTKTVVKNISVPVHAATLGPWAPDGQGETFEVTCNETNCTGVHLQVWFPAGTNLESCGNTEIHTFIPPGLSVEIQNGGGKGFEYPSHATIGFIREQIIDDIKRRKTDTSFCGWIDIDDLIKAGLAEVRFDRRKAEKNLGIPSSYKP
jgi:hypothetical protein